VYGGGGSLGGGPTSGKTRGEAGEAGSAILQRAMMGVWRKKMFVRQTPTATRYRELIPNPGWNPAQLSSVESRVTRAKPPGQGRTQYFWGAAPPESGGGGLSAFNELDYLPRLERLAGPSLRLSQAVSPPSLRQLCSRPLIFITRSDPSPSILPPGARLNEDIANRHECPYVAA